jgi:predicted RNase H-like HicB family nuclease
MRPLDLQNVVYREGEHYIAQCLNVDISSFGTSESEALENLQEALELYFEDASDEIVATIDAPEVRRLTLQRA